MTDEFNHFDALAQAFGDGISQVVRKTAFDLQSTAQSIVAVDTGFLKNSIYVETSDSSDYGSGGSGGENQVLLPEVETPDDDYTAYVAVGASYGVYLEFGTRYQEPQPYIEPAAEQVRPGFEAAMGAIEDRMRQVAG